MTPSSAQSRVFEILGTHDIPLAQEDLAWAFSSEKTATEIVDYVERYLGSECFVGLEEAEMYVCKIFLTLFHPRGSRIQSQRK